MLDRTLTVRVDRVAEHTPEIKVFEFVHPTGRALPGYAPGAHIDVHTPGGFMRNYSLARAAPVDGPVLRYVIGIKRESNGRGGSAAMHARVQPGDLLAIGAPRYTFPLHTEARHHLLLGAGIGLTPLLAMAQRLAHEGAGFTLGVFARSREHLAFASDLVALGARVRLHFDDPAAPQKIDLAALLQARADGTHLYVCGPTGFMRSTRSAAAGWPDDAVHLEYFAAPPSDLGPGEAFELHLVRRDLRVRVGAGQSAVQVLHELGIDMPTSCEQGVCGTCIVPWLATPESAEPEHRDFCLSATERRTKVALCCSRAQSGLLAIDL